MPWNKGLKKETDERIKKGAEKISKVLRGRKLSEEHKKNIGLYGFHKGMLGKRHPRSGENHYAWIKDRSLINKNERNNPDYLLWVRKIKKRDSWKCKINNSACNSRLEAHHILSWKEFPELRYEINNGITLCQAHHPRKRAEEKLLISTFQELVSQVN